MPVPDDGPGHGQGSGRGQVEASRTRLGARALEWAYLFEPYARPASDVVFDRLDVGAGERLCDVACGSGLAANVAARRGASVAGLDASGRPDRHREGPDSRGRLPCRRHECAPVRGRLVRHRDELQRDLEGMRGGARGGQSGRRTRVVDSA